MSIQNEINQSKRISYPIDRIVHNMKNLLLLLVLSLCISRSFQQDLFSQYLPSFQGSSPRSLTENIQKEDVKFLQVEVNKVGQFSLVPGQLNVVYVKYLREERVNINLYSTQFLFGYLYKQQEISNKESYLKNDSISSQKQFLKNEAVKFGQMVINDLQLTEKLRQNKEYKHFLSLQPQIRNNLSLQKEQNEQGLLLIVIRIPQTNHQQSISSHQAFNLTIIITTNNTKIQKQAFQKPIQYKLLKEQFHSFVVDMAGVFKDPNSVPLASQNLSKEKLTDDIDEFFLFHNIHIVGDFEYNVSVMIQKEGISEPQSVNLIRVNQTESTYQFNNSLLQQQFRSQSFLLKSQDYKAKINLSTNFENQKSFVLFEVRCVSPVCVFVAQVEKNTEIRNVIPGIPYIYSINSFQIFQFHNPFDLDIFIDMSKKNGFPQYQICSQRFSQQKSSLQSNQCIQQLINPSLGILMFQVKQKDDKLHALGRNNQIIINSQHEAYCYKCTYYLALYTDYDTVMGMITFKNERTSVILPEGNSITKVLKRGLMDVYDVYGANSRILFERFSGRYDVWFESIDLEDFHSVLKLKQLGRQREKIRIKAKKEEEGNYYSIDLKEQIQQLQSSLDLKESPQLFESNKLAYQPNNFPVNHLYRIMITTYHTYPCTYYSLMMVNNESRKMVLKDGVPFFNKQTNRVTVFKYVTQNLQTQSFGTIIINSNQISQLQLQIYGNCLTLEQTVESIKNYRMEKEDSSTLNTLKNRMRLSSRRKEKTYELQKIQNKKINLMANRIDIIVEPQMCKSYLIKIINNSTRVINNSNNPINNSPNNTQQTSISYQILVSFIDSIILPLNNQVPGILQYPGKIIQIYQVFVPEKSTLSILINFCRSAKSRMQIYRNKEALFIQNSDQKVLFTSQSQLQEIIYQAHSGLFYITIEFFGFSSILEYTLLVKQHQVEEGFYYIDLSQDEQEIQYIVKQGRFFSTTYKLFFSPVFLKHWSKDIQRDVQYFQTKYFILQSNSYPLLKRASNCKGQFFSDIVNHHEHFKQINLQKDRLTFHPPTKDSDEFRHQSQYSRGYYSFEYETNNPLSFVIIVPVISKSLAGNQLEVIPYWQLDKKSRQPYRITQLYNGKVYSVFQHWFVSIVIWMEEIVDFHIYQSFIVMLIAICSCMPMTCCLMICIYRTKVNIDFYCHLLYSKIKKFLAKDHRQGQNRRQPRDNQEINRQESVAIPSQENQNLSQPNNEVPQDNQDEMQSDNSNQREERLEDQSEIQIIDRNIDHFQFINKPNDDGMSPSSLNHNQMENFNENF